MIHWGMMTMVGRDTVHEAMKSVLDAGVGKMTTFDDDGTLGIMGNYDRATRHLTKAAKEGDHICVLQDDMVAYSGMMPLVERAIKERPDAVYVLFTVQQNVTRLPGERGWVRINPGWDGWGGVMVIPMMVAKAMVKHPFYINHAVTRERYIDAVSYETLKILDVPIFTHVPSLFQHIGVQSTIGNKHGRHTSGYLFKEWDQVQQGMITINPYGDGDIRLKMDDPVIENEILENGHFYEYHMMDWIKKKFSGGTWVDVGANFGNHSVHLGMYVADRVVCIEPVQENYDLLRANIDRNCPSERHIMIMAGAGEKSGTMRYDPPSGGLRWSQVILGDEGKRQCPVITIDSLNLDEVRGMKIDCEGMELQVLKGAEKTLAKHRPDLFVEIWSDNDRFKITEYLSHHGYTMIERWNPCPTYHFSASGRFKVTYTDPE